ncbi:MAG: MiaB/RimO family radical SAM methylthiotransferase [Candidatus Pacearchaeota archaeon]|jgi:MiaB/RimO family radical SAM methylthiotransferase
MKPQFIFIKTYGCQANINDSEILAHKFAKKGYILTDSEEKADTILINSCSVKNKTQSKILHYIKTHYSTKKIILAGCLIKTIDLKKQFPKITILDTLNLKRLNQTLIRKDKDIAIIQISQGCLNNCAFCATKLAKGKLKSYSPRDIKFELERAVSEGCKKIYLTSQDNGCYGFDLKPKTNISNLIDELTKVQGNQKIRVGMMNPQHIIKFLPQLINSFKSPKIQKFIHIPVQSGSNKILKDMKRGHSVEDFTNIVSEFRKQIPNIDIATDIIVGYPSETDEDFEKTYQLIKQIKPEVINIASFSSRPKTQANKLKQLSSQIIKQRTKKLNYLYLSYRPEVEKRFRDKGLGL